MKNFAIINGNGEVIGKILVPNDIESYCDIETRNLITKFPDLVNYETLLIQYYWKDQWKTRQPKISKHHYWDNNLEIWTPNIEEAKRIKKDDVNSLRELKIKYNPNGIQYKNYKFSNDSITRANITEALSLVNAGVVAPENFTFRTLDNIDIPFSTEDIKNLSTLMLFYKNSCYKHSWNLKAQIDLLSTVEEI